MGLDLILKNARIPQGDRTVEADILVKDGKIAGILHRAEGVAAAEILDAGGLLVLPGCIDSHTHFMDPGFTHRETFAHGTRAAAAGGVTTIVDMPCCSKPSVRSVESLESKVQAIKDKAYVDYGMWGGATGEDVRNGWLHNIQEQADAGVLAFKVYMTPSVPTYPPAGDAEMLEIFREVAKTGLPVGIHAENLDICTYHVNKLRNEGRLDGPAWAEARLELAEKVAIQMAISFAEETGARLHIVHMSTGIGGVLIGEAKKRGLSVTAETCPHYLTLNAYEAMSQWKQYAKIAPPLRSTKDNAMLWEQLADGRVDFMATDHAPYEIATEKEAEGVNIWTAFPGIPGTETMVPIIISEGLNKGRLSLSRTVDVLSRNAAIHYGLYPKKGSMEIGADADFTIIDLNHEWTIDKDKEQSQCGYTPLHGLKLKGRVVKTVVRGKLVFDLANGIVGTPGYGQLVKRQTISRLERKIRF